MSEMGCLHQCKRCGVVYGCNVDKCGQPFGSGYCPVCSSPATMNLVATA